MQHTSECIKIYLYKTINFDNNQTIIYQTIILEIQISLYTKQNKKIIIFQYSTIHCLFSIYNIIFLS